LVWAIPFAWGKGIDRHSYKATLDIDTIAAPGP